MPIPIGAKKRFTDEECGKIIENDSDKDSPYLKMYGRYSYSAYLKNIGRSVAKFTDGSESSQRQIQI